MRKIFTLLLLLSQPVFLRLAAQDWKAPEDARTVVASFKFDSETIKAGGVLYTKNCQSCHGPVGKNMPAPINPKPEDPASAKFQEQPDGEIFWKVTHGKAPMPTFASILTEDERWQIIAYIRNFNPKYVQPAPNPAQVFKGKSLKLMISADTIRKTIRVTAMEILENKKLVPFKGAEIQLFSTKMFGKLKIGDVHKSGNSGIAVFDYPEDLPGDKYGWVEFTASVNQEGVMAKPALAKFRIAKPLTVTSLDIKGKMWSHKGEGPLWLNLVYGLSIITVWAFIIYVIVMMVKMGKIGKRKKDIDSVKIKSEQ